MHVERVVHDEEDITHLIIGHKPTHALRNGDLVLTPAGIRKVITCNWFRLWNGQDTYSIRIEGMSLVIGYERIWDIYS